MPPTVERHPLMCPGPIRKITSTDIYDVGFCEECGWYGITWMSGGTPN